MKLASFSLQRRHGLQPQQSDPATTSTTPAVSATAAASFTFHTVTWQADGFGFDATSGEFFTASSTALIVMQSLSAGMSRPQILDRLTAGFAVARSTAERDLESFLAELAHIGLMQESV